MKKHLLLFPILVLLFTSKSFAQFAGETEWATGQGIGTSGHLIGDFNGDGMSDKLNRDGTQGGDWWVSLSTGTSFGGETKWASNQDVGADGYYVGDFNGDGMADVISFRKSSGAWYLSLSQQNLSNGAYSFSSPILFADYLFIGMSPSNIYVGDFNGDGISDIMCGDGNGGWYVALSNGSSLGPPTLWESGSGVGAAGTYVGDFNGDGLCDKATYFSNGQWFVAISTGHSFVYDTPWASGQGVGSSGHFIGDLNGDGKADKLNYYASNGNWYAAFSTGNGFTGETLWCSGQGVGVTNVYVGDFNGDGLCDRTSFISNGQWWVGLNVYPQNKIVATWYSPWYALDGSNNLWNNTKRDSLKTPVVGWGNYSIGIYDTKNGIQTIVKQLQAMKAAGIDLIILDCTNGFYSSSMAINEKATATNMITAMEQLQVNQRIKIAFGLGYEFWGPRWMNEFYKKNNTADYIWPGWTVQKTREREALNIIKNNYLNIDTSLFFYYKGKPLVLAYLNDGTDYPLLDSNNVIIPSWHFNDFTIQSTIGWPTTYAYKPNRDIYHNGQDTKKFWGWGAEYPQPYNVASMSIMPGTHNYWDNTDTIYIERDQPTSGSYYIDSWERILEVRPNLALIADWNNWNEETAIEGCVGIGTDGWKDLNGVATYDWYLQITKSYSYILKNNSLPSNIYVCENPDSTYIYYYSTGNQLSYKGVGFKPHMAPIIKLPSGWLESHNYIFAKISVRDNSDNLDGNVPHEFSVEQNYPNPFNPTTNITFALPEQSKVKLVIYDIMGREITTLADGEYAPGYFSKNWMGTDAAGRQVSSGIYFYRFIASGTSGKEYTKVMKMIMLK